MPDRINFSQDPLRNLCQFRMINQRIDVAVISRIIVLDAGPVRCHVFVINRIGKLLVNIIIMVVSRATKNHPQIFIECICYPECPLSALLFNEVLVDRSSFPMLTSV